MNKPEIALTPEQAWNRIKLTPANHKMLLQDTLAGKKILELVKLNTPMKGIGETKKTLCPVKCPNIKCDNVLGYTDLIKKTKYCPYCGQALDLANL